MADSTRFVMGRTFAMTFEKRIGPGKKIIGDRVELFVRNIKIRKNLGREITSGARAIRFFGSISNT